VLGAIKNMECSHRYGVSRVRAAGVGPDAVDVLLKNATLDSFHATLSATVSFTDNRRRPAMGNTMIAARNGKFTR
jgi:hypothetical protein